MGPEAMRWSSSPCKVNFNSKPKVVASEQDEEEDDVEDEGKYNEDYYHYTTVTPTIRSPAFMATFTQLPTTSSSTKPAEPVTTMYQGRRNTITIPAYTTAIATRFVIETVAVLAITSTVTA